MPQVAIVMPKMSMTMTEGELLVWHVEVGQTIKAGDVVCEVATDKVDMEVEATASGVVTALIGNPGDVSDVGSPLVMVESLEDDLLEGIFDSPAAPVAEVVVPVATVVADTPAAPLAPMPVPVIATGPLLATPKARDTAKHNDLDIRLVTPSGSEGVITTPDVLNALANGATNSADRTIEKRLKTRLAIARAIAASADIPGFSMTFEVAAPKSIESDPTARTAHWAFAWAQALRQFPELHADWNNGELTSFPDVRIAFSVMASYGVLTPTVVMPTSPDADFINSLRSILASAKEGKIALEHLGASSTGLADVGSSPVTATAGILIRPQSTSVAVGRLTSSHLNFAITADHRISDPADVALLAQAFARAIAN